MRVPRGRLEVVMQCRDVDEKKHKLEYKKEKVVAKIINSGEVATIKGPQEGEGAWG